MTHSVEATNGQSSSGSNKPQSMDVRLEEATRKLSHFEEMLQSVQPRAASKRKRPHATAGLEQLDRLSDVMRRLSKLQRHSAQLQRRCGFLQDTHDIMALQYKLVTSSPPEKRASNTSEVLRKFNQFISGGSVSVTTNEIQVRDDVSVQASSASHFPVLGAHLTRSSSFGSIDDVTLRGPRSEESAPQKTPMRKKSTKRFVPKWSKKVIRVFGKPDAPNRSDATSAASPEEVLRINKKERHRASTALCHGSELESLLSVEKQHLQIDGSRSEGHSPRQTSSPQANKNSTENDYAEIGPPSQQQQQQQQQQDRIYHLYDRRSEIFDTEGSDVTARLTRRNSSPTLSMSSLLDVDAAQTPADGDKLRRASSVKTSKDPKRSHSDRRRTVLGDEVGLDAAMRGMCEEDLRHRAQIAWTRVKEFVQARKDDGDHVYCSISPEVSPQRGRRREKNTTGSGRNEQSTSCDRTVETDDQSRLEAEMPGLSALSPELRMLVGNLSDEFNQKMSEWESKKRKGRSEDDGATKFSEDFIRRMEAWEKMKGVGWCTLTVCYTFENLVTSRPSY